MKVKAKEIETSGMKDFRGNVDTENMDGTVGGGGPKIEVETSLQAILLFM
jgi:hypothetical protein